MKDGPVGVMSTSHLIKGHSQMVQDIRSQLEGARIGFQYYLSKAPASCHSPAHRRKVANALSRWNILS